LSITIHTSHDVPKVMCGKIIIVVCFSCEIQKYIILVSENGVYILFNILTHFYKCHGTWKAIIIKIYSTYLHFTLMWTRVRITFFNYWVCVFDDDATITPIFTDLLIDIRLFIYFFWISNVTIYVVLYYVYIYTLKRHRELYNNMIRKATKK